MNFRPPWRSPQAAPAVPRSTDNVSVCRLTLWVENRAIPETPGGGSDVALIKLYISPT